MINPRNVLLIINSDIAQSAADANWYATARGLRWPGGGYHQLHFNFGTANSVSVSALDTTITCRNVGPHLNKGCTRAIADYVKNNDIDAIILSTHCPARVTGLPSGDNNANSNTGSLAPFLGIAGDHVYPTLLAVGSRTTSPAGYTTQRSTGTGYDSSASSKMSGLFGPHFSQHKIGGLSRPWGRIGMPRPDTSTASLNTVIAEGPAPANSSLSLMQRCVLDALWGETQNHAEKMHLVGGTTSTEEADVPTLLTDFAATRGMTYTSWGSGGRGWATGGAGTQFFQSGGLNPPLEPFGMIFAATLAYDGFQSTARAAVTNWKPMRGGWTFHWAEGGRGVGQDSIALGACAAVFPYWGAETNGLPRTFDVLYGLVDGRLTLAEAVFFSRNLGFARCEVVGDPLYVPYKNTSFPSPTTSAVNPSSAALPTTVEPVANPVIDTSPGNPPPVAPAVNIPTSFDVFRGNTINLAQYVTLAAGATLVSVAVTAGTLPFGLFLTASTGSIFVGTSMPYGIVSGLKVTVTDSNGLSTQSGSFSINVQQTVINPPPPSGIRWIDNAPTEVSIGANETFDLKTLFTGSTTGTTRAIIVDEAPLATLSVTEASDGVLTGGATMPSGFVDVQVYATDQPNFTYTNEFEANNYTDDDYMPADGIVDGIEKDGWAGLFSNSLRWRTTPLPGVFEETIPYYDVNTTQGGFTPPLNGTSPGLWAQYVYTAPNTSTSLPYGTKIDIDVTQLVKCWAAKGVRNAGFWIKQVGGSQRQSFATRQYAELPNGVPAPVSAGGVAVPSFYPKLTITGSYNAVLDCLADSSIDLPTGSGTPNGGDPAISNVLSKAGAIMYFSMKDVPNAAAVTNATLTLTVCRQYVATNTTTQYLGTGSFTYQVFRARHPFKLEPEYALPAPQTGIAWNYARDKGLETHPDIIACERFDGIKYNSSGVQVGTYDFRTQNWWRLRVTNALAQSADWVPNKPGFGDGKVIIGDYTEAPDHSMQALYPNMPSMQGLWEGFDDGRFPEDRMDRDKYDLAPTKNIVYTWNANASVGTTGTTVTLTLGIPETANSVGTGAAVWQPVYVEKGKDSASLPTPLTAKKYYANNISAPVNNTAGTAVATPRGKTITLHETIGGPAISITKTTAATVFTVIPVGDGAVLQPNVITLPRGVPHTAYFPSTRTGSLVYKPIYIEEDLIGAPKRTPYTNTGCYFANNISADGKSFTLHAVPFGPALTLPVQPGPITVSGARERAQGTWASSIKLNGGGGLPGVTEEGTMSYEEMYYRVLYLVPTNYRNDIDSCKNLHGGFDGRYMDYADRGMGVGNSGNLSNGMHGWSIRGHFEFCGTPAFRYDTPFLNDHAPMGTYSYCNSLWSHDGAFDVFPWPGTVTGGNPEGTWGGGTQLYGHVLSYGDWGLGFAKLGKWYCYEARCKINTVRPNNEPVYIGDGVVNTYTDGTGSICPPGYACYDARHANPAFGGAGAGAYPDTFRSRYNLPATWSNGKAAYSETLNALLDTAGHQFFAPSTGSFAIALTKNEKALRRAVIERLPTRGNYDGEYEIWVNGRKVQSRVGYMMRHVEWITAKDASGNRVPFGINQPFMTTQVGGNIRNFMTRYTYAAHIAVTGTPVGSTAAHPRAVYIGPPRNVASLP